MVGVIDRLKAFVTRKRSLRFVIGGLALVLAGHLLENVPVISKLQGMTVKVETSLRAIQPFEIADIFSHTTNGRRGLWFCAPVGASDQADGHCPSIIGTVNAGLASAFALPAVTGEVWENGGVISATLFVLTLFVIILLIVAYWRQSGAPDSGVGKSLLATMMLLASGPLIAGAAFWLLLQLLLLLILLFGKLLAGIAWLLATFGVVYKVCALLFTAIESGDKLQDRVELITGGDPKPKT